MTLPIPQQLLNTKNEEVLNYLAPLSCHGDNIEPLRALLFRYPDVDKFCPDAKNYLYFLWYLQDTIFAYGVGMQKVGLRIPEGAASLANLPGIDKSFFDGQSWYSFPYDYERLNDMVKLAYNHARSES